MPRIPYLHYYYTWKWLEERNMPDIAHIAANHSTWDLEFENLPIESLILIYADFRVRAERGADGKEMTIVSPLTESRDRIFVTSRSAGPCVARNPSTWSGTGTRLRRRSLGSSAATSRSGRIVHPA